MSSPTIVVVGESSSAVCSLVQGGFDLSYDLESFPNGTAAMESLPGRQVSVVIVEQRTSEADALALLRHIEREQPEAIRVLLAIEPDRELLLSSLKTGLVDRYIEAPWSPVELRSVVDQSLELVALRRLNRELTVELDRRSKKLERRVEDRTERLMAIEKEAELGKYTSQIVHSLKVPLQSIGGAVLMANLHLKEDNPIHTEVKRYLDSLLGSVGELQKVIAGIIAHTANERFMRKDRVDVNQIVRREIEFFELDQEYKHHITKVIDLCEDVPVMLGNPLQIKQIVDNLITNAIDAMETTATKRLVITSSRVDDSIQLSIGDTGSGITRDQLDKIFSPYFTTKPLGKGTGIGLASVKKMVESYGGSISVASTRGQGSTFTVQLPVSPPVAAGNR